VVALDREFDTLTDLRVRSLIADEEFTRKRLVLTAARLSVKERVTALNEDHDWIEPLRTLISFSSKAAEYFYGGDDAQKRLILVTTSSNPTLIGRILNIEARKPFVQWGQKPTRSEMRRFLFDVRTLVETKDEHFINLMIDIKKIISRAESLAGAVSSASIPL
jgi:hypothetical protein